MSTKRVAMALSIVVCTAVVALGQTVWEHHPDNPVNVQLLRHFQSDLATSSSQQPMQQRWRRGGWHTAVSWEARRVVGWVGGGRREHGAVTWITGNDRRSWRAGEDSKL